MATARPIEVRDERAEWEGHEEAEEALEREEDETAANGEETEPDDLRGRSGGARMTVVIDVGADDADQERRGQKEREPVGLKDERGNDHCDHGDHQRRQHAGGGAPHAFHHSGRDLTRRPIHLRRARRDAQPEHHEVVQDRRKEREAPPR